MVQLVRAARAPRPAPEWDEAARRVLRHPGGPLRVLGGPGSGKTTLIAECLAERIAARGVDPERVLVLTAGRRAAAELRERVVERLAELGRAGTVREPLVRTVHSYAFALLRLHAALHDERPPRLLSSPEQDVVIRELLAGDVEDGAAGWPPQLRPALLLPAFAAELRDLLLRAAERGLGPEDLTGLGRRHRRPEWVAAGRFFAGYEQVTLLRGAVGSAAPQATAPALDAAELVSAALLVLDSDATLLRRERERVRHLFVDDAQHLDPQQAALLHRIGDAATERVLFGDPDQGVFAFRGADPQVLGRATGEAVVLTTGHRMAPAVRQAVGRLSTRLPGPGVPGVPTATATDAAGPGSVTVQVFCSAAQEAAWVADRLRRAHLLDGVAWSSMAVLVRSTARSLPALRRAMLAARVPVAVPPGELPLARQAAVVPLLTLLRCALHPDSLDEDRAVTLLASPLGGADPLALRRLRRELRRLELAAGGDRASGELLVEVLRGPPEPLAAVDERAAAPARRLAGLLHTAAEAAAAGGSAEEVLWQVWQGSGLAARWAAAAARGGAAGAQADRDLDSVVALFDAAARYTDRLAGAGVAGFPDYVADQQIPGDSLAPRSPQGQAVAVLTAHAAAGREWELVAVAGVQEGNWPNLRLRGSLLGVEALVDVMSGVDGAAELSRTAPLLAEERRLLRLAASRARRTLLISAVRGEDEQPSRFLDELAGTDTAADADARPALAPPRGLVLPELVGELRRVACDPSAGQARRRRAARRLARLAAAGIPGAHPDDWYGLASVSTEAALRPGGAPARVSPSAVELVSTCPLRWVLTRHGGEDASRLPAVTGTLVHALVQAAAAGASDEELEAALRRAWVGVDAGAPWYSRSEQRRVRTMVAAFRGWYERTRGELTQVALEQPVELELSDPAGGAGIVVSGRVDRLERDAAGRPVVVDVKTSKSVAGRREAAEHPQLAVYQLAAASGAFAELGLPAAAGGARLLYLAKPVSGAACERLQPALDEAARQRWLGVLSEVARRTAGPVFRATENTDCGRCPSRIACPLHDSGRQVTE